MSKLSIIVPIYKVEAYLPKCIESVLAQSYQDWELILVNDGSPDACPRICDQYAARDARIRVIHQNNAGVSAARNRGLDAAAGDLIAFIDPDDYLRSDCYERMLEAMDRTGAGMAICGFLYEYPDGSTEPRVADGAEVVLSHHDLVKAQFDIPWSIRTVTYNKIFQKSVIGELRFDEKLRASEDTLFLCNYLERYTGTAIHIRKPLYVNLQREGSAMHGGLALDDITSSFEVHRRIADIASKLYADLFDEAYYYYLDCVLWKTRSSLSAAARNFPEQQKLIRAFASSSRHRIWREMSQILRCRRIGYKQKLFFLLYALAIR